MAVSATLSLTLASSLALAQKGDAAKGKEVFEQCAVCHSISGEKKMGPTLKGLYQKGKLANGQKVSDATVSAMINKGKGNMPAFAEVLSAEEKTDLLAFLKTI
ncbi:MAG: cytochrome c [Candidatus Solibacter usitatus]|nr:cytochrome c [Candidatus Solibacter usitatus]